MAVAAAIGAQSLGLLAINWRLATPPPCCHCPLAIVAVIGVISLSIYLERAASVERATLLEGESDLRLQIWPIVLDMTRAYFPVGTGFGTFDSAYRIGEPDSQLNAHYVNLAHNDWLQVVLEGGVLGLVLLAASFLWFGLAAKAKLFEWQATRFLFLWFALAAKTKFLD